MNEKMYEIIKNKEGFIAALDQSGGSSSKTLKAYGIPESAYSTEEEMEASLKRKVTFNEVANKMGMNPTELKLLFDLSNVASLDETVDDDREISAIEKIKEEKEEKKVMKFKKWFNEALFPILNEFAAVSGCCLKIDQDACGGMTVTLRSKYGVDITANQKQMHMAIAFADHIAVNKWSGADEVELTLIYGIPEED